MPELEAAGCVPKFVSFPSYRSNDVASILRRLVADSNSVVTTRALDYMAKKACTVGKGDMRSILRTCLSALSIFEHGLQCHPSLSPTDFFEIQEMILKPLMSKI